MHDKVLVWLVMHGRERQNKVAVGLYSMIGSEKSAWSVWER